MGEENIAYFAINNPFASNDMKKKYDFTFRFVHAEYNLDRQYRFNIREDENIHNLIDKIAAAIGKSLKIHKEEKDKQENKESSTEKSKNEATKKDDKTVFLARTEIKFLKNDTEMNYNTVFSDFNNIKDAILFKLLDRSYNIIINCPKIFDLQLPSEIYINFPLYPSIFDTVLVDLQQSEYTWSKSLDKTNWTNIANSYSYTPTQNDINYYLKLKCVPKFKSKIGTIFEAESKDKVGTFPLKCPFENRHKFTQQKLSGKTFRIVSYNILSDQYIKGRYAYCQENALNIDYRKQLILKELTDYKADIICLQETDYKVYKNYLREEFAKLNYKSVYTPKNGKPEGLSLFYFEPRFTMIKKNCIHIAKEIEKNPKMKTLWKKIQENENVAKKLVDQNTVLQVLVFKSNNKNNEILIIGNTHLFYHPEAKHIRLLQIAVCDIHIQTVIQQISRQYPKDRISLIFCGDLNSQPTSGVYEFFSNGRVPINSPDWSELPDEIVKNIILTQNRRMESAYGAPKFTNYTDDFQACLDYIFYEKKFLELKQVVPLLSEEEMKEHTALPSKVVPSDHVALIADFKWK